jgi:hypothetical protein
MHLFELLPRMVKVGAVDMHASHIFHNFALFGTMLLDGAVTFTHFSKLLLFVRATILLWPE